jgi:hypothetical protein
VTRVGHWYQCPAIKDIDGGQESAAKMREMWKVENALQKRLEQYDNESKLRWSKYDAATCFFPSLTENDMRELTFGKNELWLFLESSGLSRLISNQNGQVIHS